MPLLISSVQMYKLRLKVVKWLSLDLVQGVVELELQTRTTQGSAQLTPTL